MCTGCKETKEFKFFNKCKKGKYGVRSKCKDCTKSESKQYGIKNSEKLKLKAKKYREKYKEDGSYKEYYEKNKERLTKYNKQYYLNNKEELSKKSKIYYINNKDDILLHVKEYGVKNKEVIKAYAEKYRLKNKDKIKAYRRIYEKEKMSNRMRATQSLRLRVRLALKSYKKSASLKVLLGCELDFFREYLESKFTTGMTWGNYGVAGWHIDHIKPCSSFDLSDPEQQKKCFHYTNTQPLWATTAIAISYGEGPDYIGNLEKSNKITQ